MLGEDRWSCGAVGEALLAWGPDQMVLAWGHQIFAEMQGGHLEGRSIEGRWFVWGTVQPPGDCSAPRGHWLCLDIVSVVTTGVGAAFGGQRSGNC